VTVVLIVCSYNEQEFVRVGYYVNNEYEDMELRETPPEIPDLSKVVRNILAEKPRVTRVPIKWDGVDENPPPIAEEDEDAEDADYNETAAVRPEAEQSGFGFGLVSAAGTSDTRSMVYEMMDL
jgi:histone chaperone ASF1